MSAPAQNIPQTLVLMPTSNVLLTWYRCHPWQASPTTSRIASQAAGHISALLDRDLRQWTGDKQTGLQFPIRSSQSDQSRAEVFGEACLCNTALTDMDHTNRRQLSPCRIEASRSTEHRVATTTKAVLAECFHLPCAAPQDSIRTSRTNYPGRQNI